MSDDYCVYARNILGRLNDVPISTGFSSDITNQASDPTSPTMNSNLMIMAAMLLVFIAISFLRGSSKSQSTN